MVRLDILRGTAAPLSLVALILTVVTRYGIPTTPPLVEQHTDRLRAVAIAG